MNPTTVAAHINSRILHRQTETRLSTLQTTIERLQNRLRESLHELRELERNGEDRLEAAALTSVQELFPGMELDAEEDRLIVTFQTIPFVFHLKHDDSDLENTDVYQTLPLYSFVMEVRERLVTFRNVTGHGFGADPSQGLLSGVSDGDYSHPQVIGCDSAAGDCFEHICFGNNRFLELLDRTPLRSGDIIDFLRRAALWISRCNMGDSYRTPLYKAPVPHESLFSPDNRNLARELFAFCNSSLRPLLREDGPRDSGLLAEALAEFHNLCARWPSRLGDALEILARFLRKSADDADGTPAGEWTPLALAHFCYVFWLYEVAGSKVGLLRTSCLEAAMLTDLDALLSLPRMGASRVRAPSHPLPAWRKALFDNPLHLSLYVRDEHGLCEADRRELLEQLPTP